MFGNLGRAPSTVVDVEIDDLRGELQIAWQQLETSSMKIMFNFDGYTFRVCDSLANLTSALETSSLFSNGKDPT